jgi:chromosome segregation ATPase
MDATPNWRVEMQRLRKTIAEQHANIERQKLEIMEMADRKRRHEENIEAANKAIKEMEANLKSLENEHGALGDKDLQAARRSLES